MTRQGRIFYAGFAVIMLVMVGLCVAAGYAPSRDVKNGFEIAAVLFGLIGTYAWQAVVVLYVKPDPEDGRLGAQ